MKKLSEDVQKEIIRLYKSGKNCIDVSKKLKISRESVNTYLKKFNIEIKKYPRTRKYTLDENYFSKIDSEDKAYFLGLLYADGYNNEKRKRIALSLQSIDNHILEDFLRYIKCDTKISIRKYNQPNMKDEHRINIISTQISNDLVKLGCPQRKSLILQFPNENQVPKHLLQHFIRGFFDGDGSFYLKIKKNSEWHSFNVSFVCTIEFANELKNFINYEFNIKTTISNYKYTSMVKLYFGGNIQTKKFMDWMYKDATIFLERKHNKYQNAKTIYDNLVNNLIERDENIIKDLSKFSVKEIAKKYNLCTQSIYNIRKRNKIN